MAFAILDFVKDDKTATVMTELNRVLRNSPVSCGSITRCFSLIGELAANGLSAENILKSKLRNLQAARSTMTIVDDPHAVEEGFTKKGGQNPDVPTTKRPAPPVGIGSKTPTPLLSRDDEAYGRISDVMALAAVETPPSQAPLAAADNIFAHRLQTETAERIEKIESVLQSIREQMLQASECTVQFQRPPVPAPSPNPLVTRRRPGPFLLITMQLTMPLAPPP